MLVMFRLYRKDDAYYDSLAATAKAAGGGDDMSDVSDADPVQLLRELVQLHPTSFRYCLIMLHISPSHCTVFLPCKAMHNADSAVACCLHVHPSICPSVTAGVLLKWLNISSNCFCRLSLFSVS